MVIIIFKINKYIFSINNKNRLFETERLFLNDVLFG